MKTTRTLLIAALALLCAGCGTSNTVPITGRKTHLLVDDAQILSLSTQQYQSYMQGAKVSSNQNNTALVKRVGQNLAKAVESFLMNNGYAAEVSNFQWEFNLVADNQVNAFCMPGGKIVVYEGMLPVTQDETGLAIVLGHEIAHAVAKHSAEQMSKQNNQSILASIGTSILGAKMGQNAAEVASSLASTGLTFLNAHYSRDNESEADHMGLIFAAMAGYNPNTALTFWQRMSQASSGGASSGGLQSYLSSHPSDTKRVSDIKKWLPEAMQYYNPGK